MKALRNILFAVAGILLVILAIVKLVVVPAASTAVTEQVVSSIGYSKGLTTEQVDYLNTHIDAEDKKTIENIVENHMFDTEMISQATELVQNQDKEALMELANDNLTAEEKEQVRELYTKYEEQIAAGYFN